MNNLSTLPTSDMDLARELAALDLSAESRIQSTLRERLIRQSKTRNAPARRPASLRTQLVPLTISVLMFLLAAFNQPVFAGVQRMLGYGYLPETGFFKLAGTDLLKGPVIQPLEDGASVSVWQGVSNAEETRVWVKISGDVTVQPVESARLDLAEGVSLPVLRVEPVTHPTARSAFLLIFAPLPQGTSLATLRLGDGWSLPLEWVPAAKRGLAPTEVSLPSHTPTRTGTQAPCQVLDWKLQICMSAALVDSSGAHLLLSAAPVGKDALLSWGAAPGSSVQLSDERQRVYLSAATPVAACTPGQPCELSLEFTTLPVDVATVHLHARGLSLQTAPGQAAQTLTDPLDLVFQLPERRPSISPTPRVVEEPSPNRPVPTPIAP